MRYIAVILAFLAVGCTSDHMLAVSAAADRGSESADNELTVAEWVWCNAVTAGAEKRRYGANQKAMTARTVICWPGLLQ